MSSVVSGAMVIPVAAPSTAPGMPAAPARRDSLRVDAAERTNLSNIDRMRVIRQNMVAKRITQIKFDEGLISGAAVEASEVDVTSPSTSLDPTSPEFLAAIAALSKQKAAASSASGGSDTASQPRSSLEVLSLKANGIYRRSRLDKFTDDDGLLHFPPTSADYAHILPSNHVTSKHSFSPKSLLPKSSSLAVPSAPVVASTILADDSKFVSDVPFEVKVTEIAKDTSNDLTSELSFFDEPPSLDLRFDREAEIGNVDIKPPPLLKNDQDSKPSELDFERLQESTGKIVGRISPSPPIETISNLSSTPSPPISTLNDGQKLDHYHYESFRTELPPLEHPSSASPTPSSIFPSTYGVAAVDTLSVYSFNQSHGGYAASAMPSGGQTSAADDTVGEYFLPTYNEQGNAARMNGGFNDGLSVYSANMVLDGSVEEVAPNVYNAQIHEEVYYLGGNVVNQGNVDLNQSGGTTAFSSAGCEVHHADHATPVVQYQESNTVNIEGTENVEYQGSQFAVATTVESEASVEPTLPGSQESARSGSKKNRTPGKSSFADVDIKSRGSSMILLSQPGMGDSPSAVNENIIIGVTHGKDSPSALSTPSPCSKEGTEQFLQSQSPLVQLSPSPLITEGANDSSEAQNLGHVYQQQSHGYGGGLAYEKSNEADHYQISERYAAPPGFVQGYPEQPSQEHVANLSQDSVQGYFEQRPKQYSPSPPFDQTQSYPHQPVQGYVQSYSQPPQGYAAFPPQGYLPLPPQGYSPRPPQQYTLPPLQEHASAQPQNFQQQYPAYSPYIPLNEPNFQQGQYPQGMSHYQDNQHQHLQQPYTMPHMQHQQQFQQQTSTPQPRPQKPFLGILRPTQPPPQSQDYDLNSATALPAKKRGIFQKPSPSGSSESQPLASVPIQNAAANTPASRGFFSKWGKSKEGAGPQQVGAGDAGGGERVIKGGFLKKKISFQTFGGVASGENGGLIKRGAHNVSDTTLSTSSISSPSMAERSKSMPGPIDINPYAPPPSTFSTISPLQQSRPAQDMLSSEDRPPPPPVGLLYGRVGTDFADSRSMSSPTHHVPQKLPSQPPPVMQMPNVGENLASQQDVGQPPLQQGGLVGLPGGGVPMDLYGVSRGYYGFDTAAVPIMPPRTWMLEKQKEQDMLMAQQKQQQDSATKPETSLPTPANALSNPLSPASAIPSRLPSTPVPSPTRITISRKALQAVTPLGDIRADSPSGPPPPVTDDDIEETDLVSDAIRTTVRRHYKTVRRASSVAVHNSLARRNTASSVESSMSSGSGGGGSLLARIGTDLRRNSSIPILYKIQGAPGEILRRRITERREMGGMRPEMEQLQEEEEEREWATNILDQCLPLEHQEFVQVEGGGDNEKTIEELVFLDEDEEEGNSVVSHQQQEMVQRVSDMSTVPAAVRYSMHTSDITERGRGVIVNLHRRFVKLAGGGSYTLSPISKLAAGAASIAIAIASIDGPSNDLPNAPSTNLASQPPNPKFVENDIAAPAVAWLAAPDSDDDDEEAVQEIISQNLPPPPRPAINVPRDILHPYEPCPCVVEPHRAFASPFLAFVAKGPDGGGIGTGCCSALVCVGCLDLAVERGGGIGGFRGGGSGGSSGSSGNMDPVDNAMCPVCGRGLKVR